MKKKIILVLLGIFLLAGCENPDQEEKISEQNFSPLQKIVVEEQKNQEKISAGLSIEKITEDEETLVVEIFLQNPQQEEIQSVQSWFTYPTKILEGQKIEMLSSEIFDLTAPGEQNFDTQNGLVKIGLSVGGKAKKIPQKISLARVHFTKISSSPVQLEFFNIEKNLKGTPSGGNTRVMSLTPTGIRNILDENKVESYKSF